MNFTLYKKRDFSACISDTISFFKTFGSSYFKNYITINGGFLIVLIAIMYFVSKVYFKLLFSNSGNLQQSFIFDYFNENKTLLLGIFVLLISAIIAITIITVSYPIVYLKLLTQNNNDNFSTSDIIEIIKQNAVRLLLFFLGLGFIVMPLLLIPFFILGLLCVIIIGFPLLLIFLVAVLSWIHLSLFDFVTEQTSFFTALKNGYKLLKQRFWNNIGVTLVVFLIFYVIQISITTIPYFLGLSSSLLTSNPAQIMNSETGYVISFIYIVSTVLSALFGNVFIINQGIIYYSLKDETGNHSMENEINQIGLDNE